MKATEHNGWRRIAWWAVAGFIVGKAMASASLWPDLYQRLLFALSGSRGESSDWGEPVFYMAITGVPVGLLGAAIAGAVAYAIRRSTKPGL
jgi:hypothetical protein